MNFMSAVPRAGEPKVQHRHCRPGDAWPHFARPYYGGGSDSRTNYSKATWNSPEAICGQTSQLALRHRHASISLWQITSAGIACGLQVATSQLRHPNCMSVVSVEMRSICKPRHRASLAAFRGSDDGSGSGSLWLWLTLAHSNSKSSETPGMHDIPIVVASVSGEKCQLRSTCKTEAQSMWAF